MTTWRKIRDTAEMNRTDDRATDNLHTIHELAAWPDVWVLRGGSSVKGHTLYGLDVQENRLLWSLKGLAPPEGLGWSYKRIPLLTRVGDLAVVATYVGRNRERTWLLALDPRTGALAWRHPVTWSYRPSGKKLYTKQFIGLCSTGDHLVVMENRAPQGEETYLLWLDPATGEAIHECPAPLSEDPAVVAGGYVHLLGTRGRGKGLYRVPAAPGAPMVDQLLDTFVNSLMAQDNRIYAIHTEKNRDTGDYLDWMFLGWDAPTLEEEIAQVLHWDDDAHHPRLMAVDPAAPDHVVVHRDTQLWALDLRSGAALWEHTFQFSTSVEQVVVTPHGALLIADAGVEGLDLATGARSDLGMDSAIGEVVAAGDYVLGSRTFDAVSTLYVAEDTPAAEAHPTPVTGDERWTTIKLRALLPDLLTDPRDALETAFGKAAGRGSLNTLAKTVRQITKISQTHQHVKAYLKALKAGELDRGPLNFTPLAALHTGFFYYADLFGFGPDDRFFPGVLMAGEYGGVEFYLMWATGKVISLHHDASFAEVAYDVWHTLDKRVPAFEREFPAQGSALDIAQLVRFQQTFAEVEDTGDLSKLDTRDYLTRTAAAFDWSLTQLRAQLDANYLPLEFLHIYDEDLEVLDTLITEGD